MGITLALIVHVLAIVLWIGGVAMVTLVLLPTARRFEDPADGFDWFARVERRFAGQARLWTLLAGASGFYMLDRLALWRNLATLASWWVDAMILLWLAFAAMLFVIEPLFLDRWLATRARLAPAETLARMQRLHWILLSLSLITIAGAVAGSHGLTLPG